MTLVLQPVEHSDSGLHVKFCEVPKKTQSMIFTVTDSMWRRMRRVSWLDCCSDGSESREWSRKTLTIWLRLKRHRLLTPDGDERGNGYYHLTVKITNPGRFGYNHRILTGLWNYGSNDLMTSSGENSYSETERGKKWVKYTLVPGCYKKCVMKLQFHMLCYL